MYSLAILTVLIVYLTTCVILNHASSTHPIEIIGDEKITEIVSLVGGEITPGSRARLSKMQESDAPHLQALLRDLWHWRVQDSPEFATMVRGRRYFGVPTVTLYLL